jgi:hypothetical protein
MTFALGYPIPVRRGVQRSFPASFAFIGVLLFPLLLVSTSPAQSHGESGASSSSNSGSSGHSFSGGAPSASAPTFTASSPNSHSTGNSGATFSGNNPHSTSGSSTNHGHPHRSSTGEVYYYPYWYAVPVPYSADASDADNSDEDTDEDPDYQGGPTVFDRRGSGAASYVPPVDDGPAHPRAGLEQAAQDAPVASNTDGVPVLDPTVLIFKDGHQLEIENYAVVSQTLYDLTPGHHRKIALADLDLAATEQLNDDRGVTFELPSSAQAN